MENIEDLSEKELEKKVKLLRKEIKRRKSVKGKSNYDEFKEKVEKVLKETGEPLTWTEIKERAGFVQKVPNNKWVNQLEEDIGLIREKVKSGRVKWRLKNENQN